MGNKIEYELESNSTIFWAGVWSIFGSGTSGVPPFVPVMRMEIAMDMTSIEEHRLPANALQLSPNPANEFININIQLPDALTYQLTLASAEGRIFKMREFQNNGLQQLQWPVDQLAPGVYFLRLSSAEGSRTERLVVGR